MRQIRELFTAPYAVISVDSSAIDGEILDSEQVRSSIARKLGLGIAGLADATTKSYSSCFLLQHLHGTKNH